MSAVAAFVVTSGLCGLAWSVESLIGFRVLQGFAGGMIMPIGMITLAQAAGPGSMGRVMSIVGVPMLLAPVLGPVIGGAIVESLSWRWIFFVNLPVGIAGLLLARRLLPSGRAAGRASADGHEHPVLDWRGLALLSPGRRRDRVRHLGVRGTSHVRHRERLAASRPGAARGPRVRRARPAHPLPDRRRRPVPVGRLRRRRGDGLPDGHRALRLDDPAAALLPDRARRIASDRRACWWRHRVSAP